MTAQFDDLVYYQGEPYSIAGINGSGLFNPQEYELSPVTMSTACWRGFICYYEVVNDALFLQTLRIGIDLKNTRLKRRHGLDLLGIQSKFDKTVGGAVYEPLNHFTKFSGGLLIGADFIAELAVNMGFQAAYKYQQVYELWFEQGYLRKTVDWSEEMSKYRRKVAHLPLKPPYDANSNATKEWIRDCFSLDYKLPFE